jgi:flagellar basal-body rod protein FlgG
MERGLYIAASGMLAEQVRQDQIANDLANASTPGYKADRASQQAFGDLLLTNTATGQTVGPLGFGAQIARTVTDVSSQPLRQTGEPLDFAVEGDGWFGVRTPNGVRYTRNGAFTQGPGGELVDQTGNPVLSQNGQTIPLLDGKVDAGQLGVFAVTNPRKQGESLFTGTAGGRATGTVSGGALEGSGVDAAKAMVDMIASLRSFEAGQKAITTIDSTLERAATQVGALS